MEVTPCCNCLGFQDPNVTCASWFNFRFYAILGWFAWYEFPFLSLPYTVICINGTFLSFFSFFFFFFSFFFSFLFCITADIALAVSGGSVLAARVVFRVEAPPPSACLVSFFVYLYLC